MSAFADVMTALRNVIVMQERLDALRIEQARIGEDLRGLSQYVAAIDKRVVRIETMIEMTARNAQPQQIEG